MERGGERKEGRVAAERVKAGGGGGGEGVCFDSMIDILHARIVLRLKNQRQILT